MFLVHIVWKSIKHPYCFKLIMKIFLISIFFRNPYPKGRNGSPLLLWLRHTHFKGHQMTDRGPWPDRQLILCGSFPFGNNLLKSKIASLLSSYVASTKSCVVHWLSRKNIVRLLYVFLGFLLSIWNHSPMHIVKECMLEAGNFFFD